MGGVGEVNAGQVTSIDTGSTGWVVYERSIQDGLH